MFPRGRGGGPPPSRPSAAPLKFPAIRSENLGTNLLGRPAERPGGTLKFTEEETSLLIDYVRAASGILLGPDCAALLEARLAPVMDAARLATGHDLLRALVGPRSEMLRERVLDRVTTHETSFFRDRGPFDALRDHVLPELARRIGRARPIRAWCAACSTGQEPYSVAMLAREAAAGIANLAVEILATDVSRDSVARAYSGIYSQMEVNRGLSPERLRRHMEPEGRHWRVGRPIRDMVMFCQHNLVLEPPPLGGFDVVLCRNVLMYFGLDVRPRVFAALHDALHPGGYLFLGAAESPAGGDLRFEHYGPRDHYCYRRADSRLQRVAQAR